MLVTCMQLSQTLNTVYSNIFNLLKHHLFRYSSKELAFQLRFAICIIQ